VEDFFVGRDIEADGFEAFGEAVYVKFGIIDVFHFINYDKDGN
jgi:hypothetical protein